MRDGSPPALLFLQVTPPGGLVFQHELDDAELVVGRSRECGLQLADESLSRRHARLLRSGEDVIFEDLGSRNGSYVNEVAVDAPIRLQPGDRVAIGGTEMILRRRGPVRLTGGSERRSLSEATAIFDVTHLSGNVRSRQIFPDIQEENRALSLLSRAGTLLIAHRPLDETLAAMLDLSLEAFGAERAAVALLPASDAEPELAAARDASGTIDLQVSRTVARTVVEERKAVAVTDVEGDPRLALADSVRLQGVRSLMCAPLWDGTAVRGLLYVDRRLGHGNYSETDLKVLSMLANLVAIKIENANLVQDALARQRLEEELAVASRIQQHLMPNESPSVPGLDLHGICRACSEVGGDFFDFFPLVGGKWAVVIADVCGKGVGGAILAASLQAALRGGRATVAPASERLAWLNAFVHERSPVDRYITAAYIEIDPATGSLTHACAGHPLPVIVAADGTITRLQEGGLPLGLFPDATYRTGTTILAHGSRLVLHTDGITEAAPPEGRDDIFGTDRLIAAVRTSHGGAEGACDAVLGALDAFTRGAPLRDDATVVVVARP